MDRLLDTHIFLAVIEESVADLPSDIRDQLNQDGSRYHVSVASLWEIGIKHRLGKLPLHIALSKLISTAEAYDLQILDVVAGHVLHDLNPEPTTRDPFDRLLLAQCAVENMKLVTIDRALADHPLSATANPSP